MQVILRWQHHAGGLAVCLAQADLQAARPIVVLTELAANPDPYAVLLDVPGAASAAARTLAATTATVVDLSTVGDALWLLRSGPFSYPDASEAPVEWTELGPQSRTGPGLALTDAKVLTTDQATELVPAWIRDVDVHDVVARLG